MLTTLEHLLILNKFGNPSQRGEAACAIDSWIFLFALPEESSDICFYSSPQEPPLIIITLQRLARVGLTVTSAISMIF